MEHIGSCEERARWEQERDRLMCRIRDLQAEKEQEIQVDELGLETIALQDDKFDAKTGLKKADVPAEEGVLRKTKSNNFFSIDESAE